MKKRDARAKRMQRLSKRRAEFDRIMRQAAAFDDAYAVAQKIQMAFALYLHRSMVNG
jgi:hypothetical protein